MYAGDTVLILSEKKPRAMESFLMSYNMAMQYCHNNSIVVNKEITQQLVFDRRNYAVNRIPDVKASEEAKQLTRN